MRFFNTAGPVNCEKHYCLSPLNRMNLDEIMTLIGQEKYFVLHAPRQTGKTSMLLSLMEYLNRAGRYVCLYVNVESGQSAREDVQRGIRAIMSATGSRAEVHLNDSFLSSIWPEILEKSGADNAFNQLLTEWSAHLARPVVLLIDEIDSLVGDTLISVLRQIRAGYDKRPTHFPQSIILCGVRDVRDYRIHSARDKEIITGGSAFNIKARSLRLGDFSQAEVDALLSEHVNETGQEFTPQARALIWDYTRGQPWLVNALAYETCFEMRNGRDRTRPITAEMIQDARENLIQRRETHLDQLADKLREDRVRRVIAPIMAGDTLSFQFQPDDVQYVVDLGLIRQERGGAVDIANDIYREVIPRELTWDTQSGLSEKTDWYISSTGTLDTEKLLSAFQEFFREHSEHWVERFDYKEAGPQLLLQAFLQRIVNSGGRIEREYGLGRGRTDLLVVWPYAGGVQKTVIELKILYKSLEKTIGQGLSQTAGYMDRCASDDGHLVIFDRTPDKTWDEKIYRRQESFGDKTIVIWGM